MGADAILGARARSAIKAAEDSASARDSVNGLDEPLPRVMQQAQYDIVGPLILTGAYSLAGSSYCEFRRITPAVSNVREIKRLNE